MNTRIIAKSTLTAAAVLTVICGLSGQLCYGVSSATIYSGNGAQFGSDASNTGSLQGFTQLRDRWTSDGVPTTITDVFSVPSDCCLFLATAPTTTFTPSQVATLQTFLNGGGTFIISHDGSVAPAMNQLLSDLGSSMQFGANSTNGQVSATVVGAPHPSLAGMSNGNSIYAFAPGIVTGGYALFDYPLGTHILSIENVAGGKVIAAGDFDMLNNVVGSFFPNDATRARNVLFWDNLATTCTVPEPTTLAIAGVGVGGLILGRRARR